MIQYIRIETDDSGEIIGMGLGDPCIGYVSAKDYISKTKEADLQQRMKRMKQKLAAESGLHFLRPVEEHLAAIKSKARLGGLNSGQKYTKDILAKLSGLSQSDAVSDHVASIKHIAWCEGENRKRQELQDILSDHSGLVPSNEVSDHIAAIKLKAYDEGYNKGWHDKKADLQKRMKQFEEAIKSE